MLEREKLDEREAAWPVFLLFFGCLILPFLNYARYMPLQDWWTDAVVVASVGIAALFTISCQRRSLIIPASMVFLLLLTIFISLGNTLLLDNARMGGEVVASLVVMSLLAFFLSNRVRLSRPDICVVLAVIMVLGAGIQALLGLTQVLGLAALGHGMVLYDPLAPTAIVGNVGQRNQYAQYLCWGILAGCYLYGRNRLRALLGIPLLLGLVLLITWTGARLPLAYFLGVMFLAWFWQRRASGRECVQRMIVALVISTLLLAVAQLFNHEIIYFLNKFGFPITAQSGSERMLEGGFGARRRVEWTKAWQVFLEHPWLGVGVGRYAAQSVWLETFGGLPKVPESVLFTQCHNLIFQLLAETGWIGTLCVGSGLLVCLSPFFGRGQQSSENLMLLSIALMILSHSMFEFPLWYLPFLGMLVIVCTLGPAPSWRLRVRTRVLGIFSAMSGALMLSHVLFGVAIFWRLLNYAAPGGVAQENIQRVDYIEKVGLNPMWSKSTDLILSNYLTPDKKHLDVQLPFYERLARDQPYVAVMLRLSICRALAGQPQGAGEALAQAIANYPDEVPKFVFTLQGWGEPEIEPLRVMALRAAQAYQERGANTDAGRLAAVMTVASPVTRKTLF
ncbi:PglL family O-oligosaccharyltransferase [Chromobacterium vaccinii]|uniref:Virulence factor membrane-bound polymerase C-terminal domain-containing protein n=1 Tax=Chromobacterium vaccinii TaxID=1108595 RepID=A0A1D9LJI2_9NEIS|nr:O-antigen ligase family protein [Chromobacterium vaccinii]AOZ51426.1 hypothetical protein BKX93_16405 [Chromobacterium vaccinii]